MVTPRTGMPRGRPIGSKKGIRTDPDRFKMALATALKVHGKSQRQAAMMVAFFTEWTKSLDLTPDETESISGLLAGRKFQSSQDMGRVSTFWKKIDRAFNGPEKEWAWIESMSAAFLAALTGDLSPGHQDAIRQLAAEAGEPEAADAKLLPMLRGVAEINRKLAVAAKEDTNS